MVIAKFSGHICRTLPEDSVDDIERDVNEFDAGRPRAYRMGAQRKLDWDTGNKYTVLFDPIPVEEGGFKPGAIFFKQEWELAKKMESVVPGMQVLCPDGTIETVSGQMTLEGV